MPDPTSEQHVKPFIFETQTKKSLYFSVCEVQSRMDRRDPDALELEYTRTMAGFLLFRPQPASIVMIGLGGGSLAKYCHRHLAQTRIRVVEINPYVIALRDEFQVPPDSDRFSIIRGDGAEFVRVAANRCDVLLVDGYDCQGHPAQLATQNFYDNCFNTLLPGGILVANLLFGRRQYMQKIDRIRHSFNGEILVVDDAERGNSIVFAAREHSLAALQFEHLWQTRTPGEAPSKPMQGAFSRVLAALKQGTS
jgi:spermidine synthase